MSERLLLFAPQNGIVPPLGLGYIASYLRKYLNYQDIAIVCEPEIKNQLKSIKRQKPDIIGFTCVTRDYYNIVKLAREVKNELEIPTIIGGSHITPIPHTLPDEFDVAVLGEGEQTMLELMGIFLADTTFNPKKLKKINGIAYHSGNKLKITSERALIKPLDSIPSPARDLFNMKKYLRTTFKLGSAPMKITSLQTSRGCPYNCVYCQASALWRIYRYFSAEYVFNEIKTLLNDYKLDTIMIADDLFIGNKKRLRRIVELIKEEKIDEKVNFWVSVRANLLDDEICKLLTEMNVFHVAMGFESNSERILKYIKKDTVTVEQNKNAVLLAKKYGFRVEGGFMIGSPSETSDDMMETYNFIKDYPIDSFGIQVTTPLPGTELWDTAKTQSLVSDYMDFGELYSFNPAEYIENFDKYSQNLMTVEVSKSEFLNIYKKFHNLWLEKGSYNNIKPRDFLLSKMLWIIITDPRAVMYFIVDKTYINYPGIKKIVHKAKKIVMMK
jgi:radical SAM superfamily enzyme YgiQ (UPF0313 family)